MQNDYNAGFYSIKVVFSPFGLLQVLKPRGILTMLSGDLPGRA